MLDVNIQKILPVTEVRDSLNKIIDDVENTDELYVVTKNGKPTAIIVGVHHLEKLTGISHKELMTDEGTGGQANSSAGAASASTPQTAVPVTGDSSNTTPATTPVATSVDDKPIDPLASVMPSAPAAPDTTATVPAPPAVPDPAMTSISDDIFATPNSNDDIFGTSAAPATPTAVPAPATPSFVQPAPATIPAAPTLPADLPTGQAGQSPAPAVDTTQTTPPATGI